MEIEEVQVGKWYKAKNQNKPARYVLYISPDKKRVQIDGDEVKIGARRPFKTMDQFLKWCGGNAKTDEEGYLVDQGQG
jgi:hypothetical protein